MTSEEFDTLIPEMKTWNDGDGIDIDSWISASGSFELAIGYSRIFWPKFVAQGPYILLEQNFTEQTLADWEKSLGDDRRAIEAVINHLHIEDLHYGKDFTERQCRYMGTMLCDIYQTKLAIEFPDRSFEVVFNDEDGLDLCDYEMTFYQAV